MSPDLRVRRLIIIKRLALVGQAVTVNPIRFRPWFLCAALLLLVAASPVRAFTDAQLIDGFERTVFGSEYPSWGWQSRLVKKFAGPVRVFVDDRSTARRGGEVTAFLRTLTGLISGLALSVVPDPAEANYRVFVIDRADYGTVVAAEVYGRPTSSFAPGKCLVRVISGAFGITRSDAVIVADEGEFLFHRCMVEEILQGLGPVNDDATLKDSVFNDDSAASTFTGFDRYILNMLYHPLVRPGMSIQQARRVLPAVLADVRSSLR
jgi:hypothetical protein